MKPPQNIFSVVIILETLYLLNVVIRSSLNIYIMLIELIIIVSVVVMIRL